jgi:hypothetical protein
MAVAEAERAAQKHATLTILPPAQREDREFAIGKHLHDAYSAAEKAIERLVEMVDGTLPAGRSFHRDLIRRAARPVEGLRAAMIGPETEEALLRLVAYRHAFRHVYGGFDYALAAPNVPLAAAALPRLRGDLLAFASGLGLAPRA